MPKLHFSLEHRDYSRRDVRHDAEAIYFARDWREARHAAFGWWQAVRYDMPPFFTEVFAGKYWRAIHEAPGCTYQLGYESMLTALLKHGREANGQRAKFAAAFVAEMKRRADLAKAQGKAY